jgi:Protein of unknown function (DUF3352)
VTATQPTSTVPAWRVAVIALVGLLAVAIGVVAGSAILNTRASTLVGSGGSYVPATAPMYIELRIQPSDAQDASLRELLGRFPEIDGLDLARPLYEQLTEKLDEAASGAELSFSGDVATWFDGRIGIALLDIPTTSADPMAAPEVPSMVLTLGSTDRAEAEAAIARLREQGSAPQFTTETHAGVTLQVAEGGGFAYAVTDDQILAAPSSDDLRAALDAHASADTTLSEAGSITTLTDALPDDWLAFAIFDLTDVMAAALEEGAAASPNLDAFRDILEHQSMRGAMAFTVGGDRVSVATATDPPTGPLAVTNADRGLADEVPGDAVYFADGGNVGESLRASLGPLKETFAAMPGAAEQIDTIEGALGADLEDLLAWMGDSATVVGWDGEQPYGGVVSVPTDRDEAARRLNQLATFATLAATDPSTGITVSERGVDGATITSLRWSSPMPATGAPMGMTPSEVVIEWTVTDDRALIGIGDRFVERALTLDPADSLAEVDRYRDAIAEMGGATNAGVLWLDLRGAREAAEAALGESADQSAMESYRADVLPWLEPLDRVVSVARLDGAVLRSDVVLLVD